MRGNAVARKGGIEARQARTGVVRLWSGPQVSDIYLWYELPDALPGILLGFVAG